MNEYEKHLLDRLNELITHYETKVESLYYQLSLEQQECAKKEIDNRMLKHENDKLHNLNNQLLITKHGLIMELDESTKLLNDIKQLHPSLPIISIESQIALNMKLLPENIKIGEKII